VDKLELKKQRLKSNLKIKGICNFLGISRSTYYLMEIGRREVSEEEEKKLKKLFGVDAVEKNN
jgi:predicted transcriptional regulator